MKKLFKRLMNRETVLYLIFGVLTTLVDWAVFWAGKKLLGEQWILLINAAAFLVAASFAYVTNKLWVFESRSWAPEVLKKEIPMFFAARLFSFLFTEAGLWFARDVLLAGGHTVWRSESLGLRLDGLDLTKIVLSVIVVILNYVFSKLVVFRKEETEDQK